METATSSAQRPLQGNLQYPSPQNLHHLLRTEHLCDLCGDHECLPSARALRLQDSSNTGSIQVTARPVLKKAGRGSREKEATTQRAPEAPKNILFLRQGEPASHTNIRPPSKLLTSASEWRMEVDLGKQLHSTLRPVLLIKLTVPTVLYSTRGYIGNSTSRLLKDLGLRGTKQNKQRAGRRGSPR